MLKTTVKGHTQMEKVVQSVPTVGFGSVKYLPSVSAYMFNGFPGEAEKPGALVLWH